MYLNHVVHADSLVLPKSYQNSSVNKLLSDMKLLQVLDSGCISYSPLLAKVKHRIENLCMSISEQYGFHEVILPLLMQKQLLEKSGKLRDYSAEFYHIEKPHDKFVVTPTTEEPILQMMSSGGLKSYKQLPMRFAEISNVYRHLKRAEGLYKSREISCVVLTTADADQQAFLQTVEDFKSICSKSFKRMGIDSFYVQDDQSGAIEYMFDTEAADRPLDKSIIHRYSTDKKDLEDKKIYGSLSMGYPFLPSKNFDAVFNDKEGKQMKPVIGTFGIGTQRCIFALFEHARNGNEKAFTRDVRPFDVTLVQVGDQNEKMHHSIEQMKDSLEEKGLSVCVDDRPMGMNKKLELAEFLSVPAKVLVGKQECEKGEFVLKDINKQTHKGSLDQIVAKAHTLGRE